ncbi:MAG: LPS export ABC transporter periplasmic protein LptC, partial [Limnohabitans sp.]
MTSRWALRRALDRLTLYLPLLAMAVLAMASWWLVRSMPDLWGDASGRPVRKDPDYHLERFTTQVFNAQGQRIRSVSGDKARHYPDSDELHIDEVRFSAVNEEGVEVTATARRGIATGDGERVTLLGQVHVVRPAHGQTPRIELHGERLVA